MKKTRLSEERMVTILREADARLCRSVRLLERAVPAGDVAAVKGSSVQ